MEHSRSDFDVLPDQQKTLLKIKLDGYIEAALQAARARNIGAHEALSLTMGAVFREMAAHSVSRENAHEICVTAMEEVAAAALGLRQLVDVHLASRRGANRQLAARADVFFECMRGHMRDQYAGDVSDVLKFAFLRALAGPDRKLGIAWYYAPGDDGRPDGRHLEWRDEAAWRGLDEDLHAGLATLPERSIAALERAAIWPTGRLFHREPMPTRAKRSMWGERKRNALDGANLVFLDPDNGIGKETQKHATFSEIRLLRKPGRAIVFITFPGRSMPHDALVQQLHERLADETDAKDLVTLRTSVSVPSAMGYVPRQRWFTLVDPDDELIMRAQAFAKALESVPRVRAGLDYAASRAASALAIT